MSCILSLFIINTYCQSHSQKGLAYTNKKLGFSLIFPDSWNGKYYIKENKQISINFYEKKSKGLLFSIILIDLKEWNENIDDIEDMPYEKIGIKHGKVYTYVVASDTPIDAGPYWSKMMGEIDSVIKTFRFID